jgi:hypothetical protein
MTEHLHPTSFNLGGPRHILVIFVDPALSMTASRLRPHAGRAPAPTFFEEETAKAMAGIPFEGSPTEAANQGLVDRIAAIGKIWTPDRILKYFDTADDEEMRQVYEWGHLVYLRANVGAAAPLPPPLQRDDGNEGDVAMDEDIHVGNEPICTIMRDDMMHKAKKPMTATELIFTETFGKNQLRAMWAAEFPPNLVDVMGYKGVPREMALLFNHFTDGGKKLAGTTILTAFGAAQSMKVQSELKRLYEKFGGGEEYLSKAETLLVSMLLFSSPAEAESCKKQIWVDVHKLFMTMWIGPGYNQTYAWEDKDRKKRADIKMECYPGTNISKWLQVCFFDCPTHNPRTRSHMPYLAVSQIGCLGDWICWVLVLWALVYGVHCAHPLRDQCLYWITGTLRMRSADECRRTHPGKARDRWNREA